MIFSVNSQVFAQELRAVCQAVNPKAALPVLLNVLLVASERGELHLHATDLEVGLSTSCDAKVSAAGTTTIPAKRLLDLVNEFTDGDVTIKTDGTAVRISCGVFQSRFQTLDAASYPTVPAPQPDVVGHSLSFPTLKELIAKTRFATSDKNIRYFMSGAQLTLSETVAAMVSTDGKHLALATTARQASESAETFVLPNKAMDFLRTLESEVGDCVISLDDRHIFVVEGRRTFHSRLVDGAFPDYQRIIPRENTLVAHVSRLELTSALRRVQLTSDLNKTVLFTFSASILYLASSSAGVGEAAEHVAITYDGPEMKLGLNVEYVLDFLAVATNSAIEIRMKDTLTPILLCDGPAYVNLVIPMR